MPVSTYRDYPCILQPDTAVDSKNYRFLAQSLSISFANQLGDARGFGKAQDSKTFRIGGPRTCSVEVSWAVGTSGSPVTDSYNALSGVLSSMTGNNSGHLKLGNLQLNGMYLSKASVSIQPMMPVIASASFIGDAPTGSISATVHTELMPPSKIAYGYTTEIAGGTLLTDSNNASIQFGVTCSREPTYTLGSAGARKYMLTSVMKDLSLDATNIQNIISYSGYGDAFSATIKNIDAETAAVIAMSNASRVVSQNLDIQEGSILNGNVVLREIVF